VTGEQTAVEIFVSVLGASSKTFVKAVASQKGPAGRSKVD